MLSSGRALPLAQLRTVTLLFGGYAACYYCRADLSVATPLLVDDLAHHGLSHDEALIRIGALSSLGVLAYALGKLFLTGLGDYWGGRRNFLIGVGERVDREMHLNARLRAHPLDDPADARRKLARQESPLAKRLR